MEGIDTTDILRLRRFATELDWYGTRMIRQNMLMRCTVADQMAKDARHEAAQLMRMKRLTEKDILP